ncbi:type I restriction enzyme HsdR N-terminal domain-containing protein [Nostoc sp. UIC 10630]|uniref:type I restriction enzyme HsdR N-terminal domain-containing protein n=1 Tax=Nostoc sp. UIC 10630 TaxID=2100146 RepID=UPI001FB12664|nr:type I restriction enzyme HsdR N-terminal domain-containing protein [Nostoc sp. UIC 10630]
MSDRLHYPLGRIQVEYGVNFGREVKRADIVVMDKDRPNTVYMLVELKKPKLKDGKDQLRSYCNATGAPITVWTNGDQISYYQRKDPNYFEDIPGLPNANQTLADILQIKFTLEDLIANDKLVKENKSLKTLIEEMEDEVLANAGVDVFEELFKLIFTKLYDEWYSGQGNRRSTRSLEFRNTGQTEAALKTKIQDLFDKAKKKWEGVFSEDAKISLTPSHLSVCVSSLENVKLFNSNLDVIDEAFEYLINQSSKGEKGQFFTPRYVIDLCVKMLNPQEDEYMIDTAAGSSGFPVHTIFHVWRQILNDEGLQASHLFSLEDKPPRCKEYVEDKVFAIDFDEKAVRVARTLNLIAGDGQTNVLHLNTLDYELWDEVTEQEAWQLSQICIIRSGTTPPDRDENLKEGVVLLKTNDIRNNVLTNNNIENYFFIDETINTRMKNTQLQAEDILINIVGATTDVIGRAAFVSDDFPKANITQAMSLLRIKDRKFIDPCYLFSFLSGFYGNQQVRRIARPTGQYNMNLVEVGSIKLPVINFNFQRKIRGLVTQSRTLVESSKKIYSEAEDLLLSELGLKDWQHTEETVAVKSFAESFLSSGRLDSEHYNPKYDQAVEKLNSLNPIKIIHLEDILIDITNGHTPLRHDLSIGDVKFLTAEHIHDFKINYETQKRILISHHQTELKRTHLNNGDILITIKGRVGNAAVVENLNQLVNINQDVALLRLKFGFNPYYLVGFLNSQLGKLLIEKASTGQINPFLSLRALRKLSIPIFAESRMQELGILIKSKVEDFHQAELKSKQLLEIAKTGVERAIETDEATATIWINQQLEALGINLTTTT